MALPEFIENATSLDDGITNQLAGKLSKMKKMRTLGENQLNDANSVTDTISQGLDNENLPDIPTENEILGATTTAEQAVNANISELDAVSGLAGSCLGGAVGGLKDMSRDAFGLVGDAMDAFKSIIPDEFADLSALYSAIGSFLAGIGIDKLIADLYDQMGCLSDSSMITSIQNEIDSTINALGLEGDGTVGDTYYDKTKADMAATMAANGVDGSFITGMTDSLSEITASGVGFAETAKAGADEQIQGVKDGIKDSIGDTNTPSTFF